MGQRCKSIRGLNLQDAKIPRKPNLGLIVEIGQNTANFHLPEAKIFVILYNNGQGFSAK